MFAKRKEKSYETQAYRYNIIPCRKIACIFNLSLLLYSSLLFEAMQRMIAKQQDEILKAFC